MALRKFLYVDASGVWVETPGAYEQSDFSAISTANAPVKLDASGLLGSSLLDPSRIDHDLLFNYDSAEHVNWASPGAGTIDPSNYVDNDTTYTSGDFDHGGLQGLNDDDHPSYILVSGARSFTGVVGGVTPTAANHLSTKGYVDAVAEGLSPKQAVRVATIASVLLASDLENGDYIDSVLLATGDRVLVKDQDSAQEENGIYIVQASGSAVRATDFDSLVPIDEINGAYVPVQEGATNAGKFYVQVGNVSTIGVDPIVFVYFNSAINYTAGSGIDATQFSSNIIQVDLYANGGLKFISNEIAVEPNDIAGEGLIDDGSDMLAIDWYSSLSDRKAVMVSTLAGQGGAAIIGIEDTGGYFDGVNVESALQEIGADLAGGVGGVTYTAGTGGVDVGDAVYVSSNDTASVYSDITQNEVVIGLATASVAAGQTFKVAANDTILPSVLGGGATAGTRYFWNGTGWQTTLPSGSGEYVWLGGTAKNGNDVHTEVLFIKKNA